MIRRIEFAPAGKGDAGGANHEIECRAVTIERRTDCDDRLVKARRIKK